MNHQSLESFLRIAELGSMSKAAIELRRSQPSLSREVALLEHRIGAKLFTRTSNGVTLTDAGQLLVESARPIMADLASLVDRIGQRTAGCLTVGTPRSWQGVVTVSFAVAFMRQYSKVALKLNEAVSSALREQMLSGLLDLGVIPFEDAPLKSHLLTPLVREPFVLIAPRSRELSPTSTVAQRALHGLKLILPPKPNITRLRVERVLARQGLSFDTVAETDTLSLGLELVRAGLGCTVAPSCALRGSTGLDPDSFSWSPISGLQTTWALCENESRSHSEAVRNGKSLLLQSVRQSVASGEWLGAELLIKHSETLAAEMPQLARETV